MTTRIRKSDRLSEAEVKLAVGDWLTRAGFRVYDERQNKNRPDWGMFKVRSIAPGKRPDLLVCGNLSAARTTRQECYVAVEIKRGYKHTDILDGFDAVLEYYADYLWGAEYRVEGKNVQVAAFVFATFFSQQGYLFEEEGKFDPRGIVRGPWDAHPMTFTISRLMWRQKDNLVKRFQVLMGLPKVERRLSGTAVVRPFPDVGVLVREPAGDGVRLMLSVHPYHWQFEAMTQRPLKQFPVDRPVSPPL
ncbi:MAG: hypothetical protein AB1523_02820 [Bacillota bacterium]